MSGKKRNTIDKFYTSKVTTDKIYNYIKHNLDIKKTDLIIEPSAGNGSFIPIIKKLSNNYIFYDIRPEHKDVIQLDFLTYQHNSNTPTHIIGNPPFGRQSSLAIKFIKQCCFFAETISFILPKSFKKETLQRHFNIYYHLKFSIDIEEDFLLNDKDHFVPCIFQIWEKREIKREIPERIYPNGYKFVSKEDNPDISFRRVGVNAGKIDTDIDDKSPQSHYFIKFDKRIKNVNILNHQYEENNTVGPKSISKQQLIKVFNNIIN